MILSWPELRPRTLITSLVVLIFINALVVYSVGMAVSAYHPVSTLESSVDIYPEKLIHVSKETYEGVRSETRFSPGYGHPFKYPQIENLFLSFLATRSQTLIPNYLISSISSQAPPLT